jgi:glycosyltransferase involved in cell wall biosynthesis
MNILLTSATGYPSPDTGGPNKIIFYLIEELRKQKINVGYISKHFELNMEQKDPVRINFRNKIRDKLFLNSLFYRRLVTHPWYLSRHFDKLNDYFNLRADSFSDYDCINFHDVLSGSHLRKFKKKKILTIHSTGTIINEFNQAIQSRSSFKIPLINRIKQMEEIAFNEASYVTFPSIAAKNMFLEDLGKPETDKLKIIYNGIDFGEIEKLRTSKEILDKYGISGKYSHYIFNVANHIKAKNIDKIILAAELLLKKSHMDACVINAGTGPLTPDLKKMVRRLGLDKNVFFLGAIPNKDVLQLMKICDFFLMTSEKVVFDMVILEALACKTVVLASYSGGNKEIIKDGINGYFLYENEPEEIVLKIINADRSVVKGAEESAKLYSINSMVEKYLDLYQN